MAENSSAHVLDSFALLAYFQAESGGLMVRELIQAARDQKTSLYVSLINVGETYYIMSRRRSPQRADEMLKDLRALPLIFCAATEKRIFAAARIKAEHLMSYADAFAVALAQEMHASLVTGDPEFRVIESKVKVLWLPEK